jgi:hypothetical protein
MYLVYSIMQYYTPSFWKIFSLMAPGVFICALVYVISIIYIVKRERERESQFARVNIQSDAGL